MKILIYIHIYYCKSYTVSTPKTNLCCATSWLESGLCVWPQKGVMRLCGFQLYIDCKMHCITCLCKDL